MQSSFIPAVFVLPWAFILLLMMLTIVGVVVAIKLLNRRPPHRPPVGAGASPSRAERTSLLRKRRDRYQQERSRILGMVDGGQISAPEAARLLDSVERETTTMACPFCEQDIRVEALKCPRCGRFLVEEDQGPRRLRRSSDKMLAGVCGGVADYTGMDVSLIRILIALAALSTGVIMGLLIYLVAALVMPNAE